MRQIIKQTIVSLEEYDDNWPPENLEGFIIWLEHKKKSLHEQFRSTAKIVISSGGGYNGDHYANIWIGYERFETDEEALKRESLLRSQKDKDMLTIRNLERTLRELKKRYEEEDSNV